MNATRAAWRQWNDITSAELRQMWADGLSGTQICRWPFKSSAACVPDTLVMNRLAGWISQSASVSPSRKRRARKPERITVKKLLEQPHRAPFHLRSRWPAGSEQPGAVRQFAGSARGPRCRIAAWPVDAGVDALFCRDQKYDQYPYCLAHCRIAYVGGEAKGSCVRVDCMWSGEDDSACNGMRYWVPDQTANHGHERHGWDQRSGTRLREGWCQGHSIPACDCAGADDQRLRPTYRERKGPTSSDRWGWSSCTQAPALTSQHALSIMSNAAL